MSSSDRQSRKSWSFICDSEYKNAFTQVNELRKMQNYFYILKVKFFRSHLFISSSKKI